MSGESLTRREYAYIEIRGPSRHESITALLGLHPSEAWNVGDVNPQNGKPRKFMAWVVRSGHDDRSPLEQHVRSVLLFLGTRATALRELWVDHSIRLVCVGYYPTNSDPGVVFDRETIRQAAQLGLEIDCDLYWLDDHGQEA